MVDAATESTSTATGAQEAANWEGDGEAWLSHLQASREQPAELSGKPSQPTADALPGADPAQAKAPHGQGKGHASTSGDDQAELFAAGELAVKPRNNFV